MILVLLACLSAILGASVVCAVGFEEGSDLRSEMHRSLVGGGGGGASVEFY